MQNRPSLFNSFFTFNKTTRKWHMALVAGLTVGIPMILGWHFDTIEAGKLGLLAGLSILYMQCDKLNERMLLLMVCCFGLMLSFSVGLLFSFSPIIAPLALGILSFGVHYSLHQLNLTKPPGNFFFIMLASIAICTPFDASAIPTKIGYVALGTFFTCIVGLVYSLLTLKKNTAVVLPSTQTKAHSTNIKESLIFGWFMCISLTAALLFGFENPYWIPISCVAVMQGSSSKNIGMRGLQRIIGTLIGLGITMALAYTHPSPLAIVIGITVLQIIVELLIVKNYAFAMIFITILTIFLAEPSGKLSEHADHIFLARLFDILIGSVIGIIGGWVLYHEKVHYHTTRQLRHLARRKSGFR